MRSDRQTNLSALLTADAGRLGQSHPSPITFVRLWFTSSAFRAAAIARLAGAAPSRLGRVLSSYNLRSTGADIDPRAQIGEGMLLQHPVGVVIGGGVVLGARATLMSGVVLGKRMSDHLVEEDGYPVIGRNVQFGSGAVALGPIRIGDNCRVGAGSIVLRDVEAETTVVGSPARPIAKDRADQQDI